MDLLVVLDLWNSDRVKGHCGDWSGWLVLVASWWQILEGLWFSSSYLLFAVGVVGNFQIVRCDINELESN